MRVCEVFGRRSPWCTDECTRASDLGGVLRIADGFLSWLSHFSHCLLLNCQEFRTPTQFFGRFRLGTNMLPVSASWDVAGLLLLACDNVANAKELSPDFLNETDEDGETRRAKYVILPSRRHDPDFFLWNKHPRALYLV